VNLILQKQMKKKRKCKKMVNASQIVVTWYVGGAFDVAKQNRTEAKRSVVVVVVVVVVVRSDTKLGVCDPVTTQFHAPVSLSLSIFTRTVRILLLFSYFL
jgi:hypothetical protein